MKKTGKRIFAGSFFLAALMGISLSAGAAAYEDDYVSFEYDEEADGMILSVDMGGARYYQYIVDPAYNNDQSAAIYINDYSDEYVEALRNPEDTEEVQYVVMGDIIYMRSLTDTDRMGRRNVYVGENKYAYCEGWYDSTDSDRGALIEDFCNSASVNFENADQMEAGYEASENYTIIFSRHMLSSEAADFVTMISEGCHSYLDGGSDQDTALSEVNEIFEAALEYIQNEETPYFADGLAYKLLTNARQALENENTESLSLLLTEIDKLN